MTNPFGTDEMAAGYAMSRPAVHPLIVERVRPRLPSRIRRALDVGCGAGLSTRALEGFAEQCIGVEPVEAMLRWSATTAPEAEFIVGAAESIPVASGSIDLITAAGSLNYVDLDLFFREAARILTSQGVLVVYDFSPGKRFRQRAGLEGWFSRFEERYPPPPAEARHLDPETLAALGTGFQVRSAEGFEVGLALSRRFYVDYMMTETNVASAVRNGIPRDEIRSWCDETLRPVWGGEEREVVFTGYIACMGARAG